MKFTTAICIALALLAITVLIFAFTFDAQEPIDWEEYTVKMGDTMWDIVEMSNGFGTFDRIKILSDMAKYQTVSDDIHPGDIVYIPIYDLVEVTQ